MKKWLLVAITLVLHEAASGQELISSETDSLIKEGIRLSIKQSYGEAIALFQGLEKEIPNNPVGYFFHAAVLQSEMMDYEVYGQEAEFLSLIKRTIETAAAHLKQKPEDPWAYFFLGGGYAYLAFYQGKQNHYFEAFQNGRRSVRALEFALRADSTLYDVYFGLGTYKYYRSKLSRHFTWLPLVKDDRTEGIQMVRVAIKKSRYSQFSAINGFFWIALEEGNYQEGRQVLEVALNEFPESRLFLWCAAKLEMKCGRWHEAVFYLNKILDSLQNAEVLSPYNELTCRKNLYQSYVHLGEYRLAEFQCSKIMEIEIEKNAPKRYRSALKEMRNSCKKESAENLSSQCVE